VCIYVRVCVYFIVLGCAVYVCVVTGRAWLFLVD
jgi:hypothetical protein